MFQSEKPWLGSYPEEVKPDADLHVFENINEFFEAVCGKYSDNTAFINMSRTMTYAHVFSLAEIFASYLQNELKLGKGDKLAIMMPNLMQYPVCFFGGLRAGLTIVNVNPLYTPRELQLQLRDSDADAVVVLENFADNIGQIVRETRLKHVIVTRVGDLLGFKGKIINCMLKWTVPEFKIKDHTFFIDAMKKGLKHGKSRPVAISFDDIALLQYTGGTTGRAKGAMLSHGNLLSNVAQCYGMYGPVLEEGKEKVVTAIPLYHVFAMTVNLMFLFSIGGTNLLITDPRRIKSFFNDLKRNPDLTVMIGVNTLFNAMLHFRVFEKIKFTRLKLAIGGGAAIQSGVAQRFLEATGINILEGYGLTECSPLVCVCPYNTKTYTGTIGIPVPSTDVRIIDEKGVAITELDVPGELVVHGPQVMQGYYKNEMATKTALMDGYCHTGDIAVWKEGGFIKIIDRIKDMILVSGFNVYPAEIEDVVSHIEDILECAAIGVPSESSGEGVCLYVVRKRGSKITADEIRQYCRKYLTPYKVPKQVLFQKRLPKTTVGKISRRLLRESYKRHKRYEERRAKRMQGEKK